MKFKQPIILSLAALILSCSGGRGLNNEDAGAGENTQETTGIPTLTSSTPLSPGLSQTPVISGTSENGADVQIFSDAACTNLVGTGTADASGAFGFAISSPQNGGETAVYYAKAKSATKLVSPCSSTFISFQSTSIRPGLAWLSATESTAPGTPTKLNQGVSYALKWSSSEFDSGFYSHSSLSSAHQITVTQDGDYFLAATLPLVMTSGTYRPCVRMEVRINGNLVPGAIGESSYIRFDPATGNSESSSHIALLLKSLSASDYIEVFVQETAGEDGSEVVSTSSKASLYLEQVSSSKNFFTANATQVVAGVDINQGVASALEWVENRKDSGFTHDDLASPENIILTAGTYLVYVNLPVTSIVQRAAPRLLVQLDGLTVSGGHASQGYMRAASGHNDSSLHWTGLIKALAGQVLTIKTQRESAAGLVSVQAGTSAQVSIEKLPDESGLISLRGTSLSGGTDWNPLAVQSIQWNLTSAHDVSAYSHSTVTNPHQVTVTARGDYLLLYNDSLTAVATRVNPIIRIQVNGVDVPGAESKTHYIRNISGHNESSASLVFFLRDLLPGDVVSVTTERENAAGVVNDLQEALFTLLKK